ncbi:T9SS type A sorting domain-containing protein [uncultured Aquimarina sp.]|uniref:T9SS type A sorting domain-containing protein n=1 Tax=uncultured Aquimarina sp. TaxID=575652 RepID=UPI0026194041|nr:T9SS type A sorting domain-containing protein [uncultured Aquimarina sp.]
MNTHSIFQNDLKETLEYTFSVYLIQSSNAIYIDLDEEDANVSYVLYNKEGQIIKSKNNLSRRNKLSLNSFPSGMYKVEVTDNVNKISKEILKF